LLWQFLAQHCGQDLANEAHLYFNEQKRLYEKRRRDEILARREQEQASTFPRERGIRTKKATRHET
jgi:hypothetical protein